jgi:hypothetical protein
MGTTGGFSFRACGGSGIAPLVTPAQAGAHFRNGSRPDRAQLRWDMVDLDSQLPDDHRARLVWAFVEGLDLSEFYDRIKARDAVAGRPGD